MMSATKKLIPLLFVCLVAGCEQDVREAPEDKADLVPVGGKVTMDGQPLANATVMFAPVGEKADLAYYGITDLSGTFSLLSPTQRPGAAPGAYTVVISKYARPDGTPFPPDAGSDVLGTGVEHVPARYSNPQQTELRATVPAGGKEDFEFPLTK
jgi:hypothetical protein